MPKKPGEFHRLALQVRGPVEAARRAAESVLEASAKRWEFVRVAPGEGGTERLEYRVRLKKSIPAESLVQSLRAGTAPHIMGVELN